VVWETAYWRKRIIIFAIGSATVITVINIVLTFAQCSPVEALWNPGLVAEGKAQCWSPSIQTNFAIFLSSTSCYHARLKNSTADPLSQAGIS
jgi:hypothetical protein